MRRPLARVAAMIAAGTLAIASHGAGASGASSLPSVTQGPPPGPPALYAPAATTPILQNSGRWQAAPIMVSGASAYRAHEFVYQDFLYDDYGANTTNGAGSPETRIPSSEVLFGGQTGDVVYPVDQTMERYAYNAADLVELRVTENATEVAFRFTLNTLKQAGAAAIAVGIDTDLNAVTGGPEWDHGLGVLGPLGLEYVLYTDGVAADVNGLDVNVATNLETNQIEAVVPRTVLNPGSSTWRMYAVTGIAGTEGFAQVLEQPNASNPGGSHGTDAPPVFNVAFRYELDGDEPMQAGSFNVPEPGARTAGAGHWREHGQALALAARNISEFAAKVDFGKILLGTPDESNVPKLGYFNRIYVSSENLGEGVDDDRPWLLGKLQPYGIYVPLQYKDSSPASLVLILHSLSCSYNQFAVFSPNIYGDLAEERYAIALTTQGRGPDSWYLRSGELDVFEAWADVARNYSLNPERVAVSGYSMGGYGTYRLTTLYPDLFAAAFPVVGPPGEGIWLGSGAVLGSNASTLTHTFLDNVRNVPFFIWDGAVDELVPISGATVQSQRFDDLGYRYRFDVFAADHFALSIVDDWDRGRAFLDLYQQVDRDPAHVTYRVMGAADEPLYGLVHDHAYWVWDVEQRTAGGFTTGLVDVFSRGFGLADPVSSPAVPDAGVEPLPYVERARTWAAPAAETPQNELVVKLVNISTATIGLARAKISPNAPLTIGATSDGAATLVLAGAFPSTVTVTGAAGFRWFADRLEIDLVSGPSTVAVTP